MRQGLFSIEAVSDLILQGIPLLLAGDEQALRRLPQGYWIGGTIPYFMAEAGGTSVRDQIFVTELPDYVESGTIEVYDCDTISRIYEDIPESGYGFIIIPASTQIHLQFALNAPMYSGFAFRPLLGWISGTHLDDLGRISAKVFNGETLDALEDRAVVMHIALPENKVPEVGILSIFEPGEGDTIEFGEDGFVVQDAYINGEPQNLADYLTGNGLDTKLPLVANYSGASVNVSFQNVDTDTHTVTFYAPVFRGITYKLAKPVADYEAEFTQRIAGIDGNMAFSCNCILNYLYSKLENRRTGHLVGPITFGEIAYQLLNQTAVYLTIHDI